jgi:hypothetical protein
MGSTIDELGPRMFEIHMWFLKAKVEAKTESDYGRKSGKEKRD